LGKLFDQPLQLSQRRAAIKINFTTLKSQFNGPSRWADYLDTR
jgi:hypothetical protein